MFFCFNQKTAYEMRISDWSSDVVATQEVRPAIDLRHLRSQPVEDAGEPDGDVTAADDDDALRQFVEEERLVRRDDVLPAGDVRQPRPAAGRDEDIFRRDDPAADPDGVRILDGGAVLDHRAAGIGQKSVVDLVEAADLPVLVRDQLRPVEAALADRPAVALGVAEVLAVMRGVGQELLRDAADIDAGAAEIALLGDRDPGPVVRREPARPHPAEAPADGNAVVT